ncbi:unnamed protein product, partial [Ectocarpus sp. 4 AP-2014]
GGWISDTYTRAGAKARRTSWRKARSGCAVVAQAGDKPADFVHHISRGRETPGLNAINKSTAVEKSISLSVKTFPIRALSQPEGLAAQHAHRLSAKGRGGARVGGSADMTRWRTRRIYYDGAPPRTGYSAAVCTVPNGNTCQIKAMEISRQTLAT